MGIRFTKMHGLGNDFMVVDAIHQTINLKTCDIAALSRRDTGIGFDQCLLVETSHEHGVDFFYRIFNADGQEVGQCGNGARCLARFIQHHGLSDKPSITVATSTTKMQLHMNADQTVTVNMGKPKTQVPRYTIVLSDNKACDVHPVDVGNPHAVLLVSDVSQAPVDDLGKHICEHPLFPEQTNVEFMQIITPNHVRLRVYERGCGETPACGSGAVAAAAAGRLYHQLDEEVRVSLPGGDLLINWPTIDGPIFLTGPAVFVYEGELY